MVGLYISLGAPLARTAHPPAAAALAAWGAQRAATLAQLARDGASGPDVSWIHQATITDTINADSFSSSVAYDGNTALIGAPAQTAGPAAVGVYVRSGATWTQQAKLLPPGHSAGTFFGSSVALSGDTALVGAPQGGNYTGAAYVFVRSGTTWTLQAAWTDPAPATFSDVFGFSVALSGDTALVSAPGKNNGTGLAYVYVRHGATWTQQATLSTSDGAAGDDFGFAVALQADTAVVGAPLKSNNAGAAYLYARSGTTWTQQAELSVPKSGWLGTSMAIQRDTVLIGAPQTLLNGGTYDAGTAYIFVRGGTTWSLQATLSAQDGGRHDDFAHSVALSGNTALIGAPYKDAGGAAFVYVRSGMAWTRQAYLAESHGQFGDFMGQAVALRGSYALVSTNFNRSPEMFVYVRSA